MGKNDGNRGFLPFNSLKANDLQNWLKILIGSNFH